jgi:hypothetical protein
VEEAVEVDEPVDVDDAVGVGVPVAVEVAVALDVAVAVDEAVALPVDDALDVAEEVALDVAVDVADALELEVELEVDVSLDEDVGVAVDDDVVVDVSLCVHTKFVTVTTALSTASDSSSSASSSALTTRIVAVLLLWDSCSTSTRAYSMPKPAGRPLGFTANPHRLPSAVTPAPDDRSYGPNTTPSTSTLKLSPASQLSTAITVMSSRSAVCGGSPVSTRLTTAEPPKSKKPPSTPEPQVPRLAPVQSPASASKVSLAPARVYW